jgi:hypothetical protein
MPMVDYPPPPMQKRAVASPPVPPLGVDYGDGELIPPLPNNPYAGQAPAPLVPGANAGGGPGAPLPESGPGVFGSMFSAGRPMSMPGIEMGRPLLNNTIGNGPPTPLLNNSIGPGGPRPIGNNVVDAQPPRYLQAQPNPMPGPIPQQGPRPMAPNRRFPRATSLIPSGPPMRQGY